MYQSVAILFAASHISEYANFLYQTVMSYDVLPVRYYWKRNINLDTIIAKVPLTSLVRDISIWHLSGRSTTKRKEITMILYPMLDNYFLFKEVPSIVTWFSERHLNFQSREGDEARVVKQLTVLNTKTNRKFKRS